MASLMFANEYYFLLSNNKRHMNRMYSMKTSLILLLIFFLNICQTALAQVDSVSTDTPKAAVVSADVSKPIITSADISKPAGLSAAALTPAEQSSFAQLMERKKRSRTNELFNKFNYRSIKYIKWPQEKLKEPFYQNESKDPEKEKIMYDKYCRLFAAQYAGEAEKSLTVAKGGLSLNSICDIVQNALKDVSDGLAFDAASEWMLYEFDRDLFKYYHSPLYKLNKIYNKSFFGVIGVPYYYSDFVLQVLILLSLGLNFFLLYKVLEKR